jgi:hypothetical protein
LKKYNSLLQERTLIHLGMWKIFLTNLLENSDEKVPRELKGFFIYLDENRNNFMDDIDEFIQSNIEYLHSKNMSIIAKIMLDQYPKFYFPKVIEKYTWNFYKRYYISNYKIK